MGQIIKRSCADKCLLLVACHLPEIFAFSSVCPEYWNNLDHELNKVDCLAWPDTAVKSYLGCFEADMLALAKKEKRNLNDGHSSPHRVALCRQYVSWIIVVI